MEAKRKFLTMVVKQGGHWIWKGGTIFWDGRKRITPLRFSYRAWVRNPGRRKVHRQCDNTLCVAPNHIRPGTAAGENHGRSTLSDQTIKQIRREYDLGHSRRGLQKELAKKFKTSVSNIHKIIHRKGRIT